MADFILKQLSVDQDFGREIAPGWPTAQQAKLDTKK